MRPNYLTHCTLDTFAVSIVNLRHWVHRVGWCCVELLHKEYYFGDASVCLISYYRVVCVKMAEIGYKNWRPLRSLIIWLHRKATSSRSIKKAEKNLANIQSPWPHALSIMYICIAFKSTIKPIPTQFQVPKMGQGGGHLGWCTSLLDWSNF